MPIAPDLIVELLLDGKPHSLQGIAESTKFSPKLLQKAIDFLVKYGFVTKAGDYLQIEDAFRSLIQEL